MPVFDSPEPIAVTLDLAVADVRFAASERADTVVEVKPSNEFDDSDVEAVAQTKVDFSNGELRITGPKRYFDFSRKTRSVEVVVELPAGSRVSATLQAGGMRCTGRIGEGRLKTSAGDIALELCGPLRLGTAAGHVTADGINGNADVSTGSGRIQIGQIDGHAQIKNSNGDTIIDAVTGDVRVRAANGDISIEHAAAGVDAKTANGNIRLGEVVRGSVTLGTAMGNLDVGVARGTAAWLEVNTAFGHVRNQMDDAVGPDETERTVEVRGRTSYGDIVIHHS
ncbi:DUF4097 domain-containing protein [Actinoplanes bogorensis]|uniref:DUF4097 domain-containing protein n=1 Tax=Paractinoplanes bogorensis TaxID=1610840 RepID=A0ABS5YUF9_9ACTN|nr:DUF4097 family beta strand repeat-containing protein [Actinoplanes bogorensis]MBU2667055.1 DUF4097 domain-containing protein [Actinoplanes bogorensis]